MKKSLLRRKASCELKPNVLPQPNLAASAVSRLERIAVAAYYKAEARGFAPGYEMDDWLEAEAAMDRADES